MFVKTDLAPSKTQPIVDDINQEIADVDANLLIQKNIWAREYNLPTELIDKFMDEEGDEKVLITAMQLVPSVMTMYDELYRISIELLKRYNVPESQFKEDFSPSAQARHRALRSLGRIANNEIPKIVVEALNLAHSDGKISVDDVLLQFLTGFEVQLVVNSSNINDGSAHDKLIRFMEDKMSNDQMLRKYRSMISPQSQIPETGSSGILSTSARTEVGGIDFDPTNMNLQIKRDGKGVPLPLPQQNLEQINIQGLFPVIINITPINAETLPIFLGQAPKEPAREPELTASFAG